MKEDAPSVNTVFQRKSDEQHIYQLHREFMMNSHQNNFQCPSKFHVFSTIPNMIVPSPGGISCCCKIQKGKAS